MGAPRERQHVLFVPQVQRHVGASLAHPDIPSLAWGKFRDAPGGRLELPFSVQAHHGFVDGFHIHQLAEQIAAELDAIISPGA